MSPCCGVATTPLDKGKLLVKAAPELISTLTSQKQYQDLIGSLLYLMIGSRPNLFYTISTLTKFSSYPTANHYCTAKRVLGYLQLSSTLSLAFIMNNDSPLLGYSDSDSAGDRDDSESISGYCFSLSSASICWKS